MSARCHERPQAQTKPTTTTVLKLLSSVLSATSASFLPTDPRLGGVFLSKAHHQGRGSCTTNMVYSSSTLFSAFTSSFVSVANGKALTPATKIENKNRPCLDAGLLVIETGRFLPVLLQAIACFMMHACHCRYTSYYPCSTPHKSHHGRSPAAPF